MSHIDYLIEVWLNSWVQHSEAEVELEVVITVLDTNPNPRVRPHFY